MRRTFAWGLLPLAASWLGAAPVLGAESAEVARIDASASSYLVFATAITLVKITALVIGYLVVKLGYTTMMAGVHGKDAVELSLAGAKLSFKGVTPGLGLGVFGVLMMVWALSTKHHFTTEAATSASRIEERQGEMRVESPAGPGTPAPGKPDKSTDPGVAPRVAPGRDDVQKAPKL